MSIGVAKKIRARDLAVVCRHVGTSLEAGVDVRKVWTREAERAHGRNHAPIEQVRAAIHGGKSLSEAIKSTDGFFPPLVESLVAVGEQSGKLGGTFNELAKHYEYQVRLRRIFLAGIAWPLIQLVLAVLIIGFLIWILGVIGQSRGTTVDVLGGGLVGNSGLAKYVAFLGLVALAIGTLVTLIRRGLWGADRFMHFVTRLPVVGDYLKVTGLNRFSWSLALVTEAGMNVRPALRTALDATENAYFRSRAKAIDLQLARGKSITEGLQAAGGFPPEFIDAVNVGEESGCLSETLVRISKQYEQQAHTKLAVVTVLSGIAVWGLVALVLIAMIFRLAMFYIGTIEGALDGI